jgi:uncharacterized phage protein gp47/JayE
MNDTLDYAGLTLKSLTEIRTEIETGLKNIYGNDINISQDSPDGQLINIFAQAATDLREVVQDIFSSFDPAQAQGIVLDQRVALNGIFRSGGTFTKTFVNITVDRSVNLIGLDDNEDLIELPSGVFIIKDSAGTQFALIDSVTITPGVHSLLFRAVEIGNVLVTIGSITTAVTAIAGITAINNSVGVSVQGFDEESDAALRTRREKSISILSQGYTDSIESFILSLPNVMACVVEENNTNITDSNGVPAHSLWAIVEDGADNDIAMALYEKKSAGCGIYGSVSVTIPRVNGRSVVMKFSRPININLYIRCTITVASGGTIDTASIKNSIVENIFYTIGQSATVDEIVCFIKMLNNAYRITLAGISINNSTWLEIIEPTTIQHKFVLDVSRITIS